MVKVNYLLGKVESMSLVGSGVNLENMANRWEANNAR